MIRPYVGDATLTATILDRLAMHAIRIDIDGLRYRQHVAKNRAAERAPVDRCPTGLPRRADTPTWTSSGEQTRVNFGER